MKITEHIKSFLASPIFTTIISKMVVIVVSIIIITIIFLAGESVGYHQAMFSYRLGENYNRIFEGRIVKQNGFPLPIDNMFSGSHGAYGKIVKIALPQIIISGSDGIEKIIHIENDSIIKQFKGTIASSSIKVGDEILVLGTPDEDGEIDATLVRLVSPNITNQLNATSSGNK